MSERLKHLAFPVLAVTIFLIALFFLHRELADIKWQSVKDHIGAMSPFRIMAALCLTSMSYLILTSYDWLAMKFVRQRLAYSQIAQTAFMAYAVGHNVGVSALSGGSIRYRVYSSLGVSSLDIAKVIAFCTATFALGSSLLIGVALWTMPAQELQILPLGSMQVQFLGTGLILVPLAYIGLSTFRKTPFQVGNWSVSLPSPNLAVSQVVVALGDLTCAAGALYILLAPELTIGFIEFAGIYLIAMTAGVLSNIPGGVGVIESVLLLAMPAVDRQALLGGMLVFRLIYYIAPLSIALLLLSWRELRQAGAQLRDIGGTATGWITGIVPASIGTLVFLCGVLLLLSGATPSLDSRLHTIETYLPLPILELSHFSASLLGVALIVVARGLFRRLRSAFQAALLGLGAGVIAALIKGLDVEEAFILLVASAVLWIARGEFHRGGSILDQRLSSAWYLSIAIAVIASLWLTLFSFRHVEYADTLWLQFSWDGQASRSMRSGVGVLLALSTLIIHRLLRPHPPAQPCVDQTTLEQLLPIIAQSKNSIANVALLGDKRILFGADGRSFLMFQVSGRSWIALGDPVGPEECRANLIWQFRELCDRYDGNAAFYQVHEDSLALYVDAGFSLSKLGESARVPLDSFSLEGSHRAKLRQAHHKAEREGTSFELVPREKVTELLPQLREVSDHWLQSKSTHEKGFSIGAFEPDYLCRFDCAVVRVSGTVVAFANIWKSVVAKELSVDLMRHSDSAPGGVMDYLFTELFLWGKEQGYAWFDLGMAPLSGLETHPLAPLWHKIGHLIYQHGDHFYNFEGLRAYKEKFAPVWEPMYLACPDARKTPRILIDSSILIAGGLRKLVAR